LFAAASWLGSWLYILMVESGVEELLAFLIASSSILIVRAYSIRKGVKLPLFTENKER